MANPVACLGRRDARPRNQGASLTAWELGQHGVPHTVIADNAGGHLMQRGMVDLCIVGTDFGPPLLAMSPTRSALIFKGGGGARQRRAVLCRAPLTDDRLAHRERCTAIPIEERDDPREVTHIAGWTEAGERVEVRLTPEGSPAANFAFDVTPARLVTALITERGVCPASRDRAAVALPGAAPARRRA